MSSRGSFGNKCLSLKLELEKADFQSKTIDVALLHKLHHLKTYFLSIYLVCLLQDPWSTGPCEVWVSNGGWGIQRIQEHPPTPSFSFQQSLPFSAGLPSSSVEAGLIELPQQSTIQLFLFYTSWGSFPDSTFSQGRDENSKQSILLLLNSSDQSPATCK